MPRGARCAESLPDAQADLGPLFDAPPELSAFKRRGGKLIIYHGWSDATIPPQPSMAFVAAIASRLGPDRVDSFVRLFLVPGLGHCTNRDHSQQFGQYGETPARGDPERDILAALERWVESGIAPEHPGVAPVSAALEKNSRQGC